MRTINIYKFRELSDEAKVVAINAHRYDNDSINYYEDKESIAVVEEAF